MNKEALQQILLELVNIKYRVEVEADKTPFPDDRADELYDSISDIDRVITQINGVVKTL